MLIKGDEHLIFYIYEKTPQTKIKKPQIYRTIGCWLLAICFWLPPLSSFAQTHNTDYTGKVKLENGILFTKDDGLPSNSIRCFAETNDGFIWVGTGEGICRFDGTEFKNYTHNPLDSNSIYDGRISAMVTDSQNLWIGHHLGFSIMDLKTEKFRNYQFENYEVRSSLSKKVATRVSEIIKARNGEIWMGSWEVGIFRYDPTRDSFICYHYPPEKVAPHFPTATSVDHVLSIRQDRFNDAIIWAGTTAGLLQINALTHEIKWFLYPKTDEKRFVAQNAVRSIYQHHDGKLYLASWHAGVNIFDPNTEEFYPLPIKNRSAKEKDQANKLLDSPISPIIAKNDQLLWIRSLIGLMTYHTESKSWIDIQEHDIKKSKIYGPRFIDSQNRSWSRAFGNGGLSLFDPSQQQFLEYSYEDYNSELFGFTYYILPHSPEGDFAVLARSADGIYSLDTKRRKWSKFFIPQAYKTINGRFSPKGYSYSPYGYWTISSLMGVYNFHPTNKTFRSLTLPKHLRQKKISSLLWDKKGRLWLGTSANQGLIRWTPDQNKWEVIKTELEMEDENSTIGNINLLFEDSRQNIWIRRLNGYSLYHEKKDSFYNFLAASDSTNAIPSVTHFVEDPRGRLWINSYHGLLAYAEVDRPDKGIVQKYDLMDSDQLTHLLYLTRDQKGMLWGISEGNLCQINPNTMEIARHSLKYGVTGDNIYGFDILPDGRFVLGGKNRIWVADPNDLLPNTEKPIPYITNINVLQEPLQTETPLHLLSSLNLDYSENFFSIDFSSIGFTRGAENKFRYRLKGFESKWTETADRRFANFTNVPSGDYIFELQAANNEGLWNEKPFEMSVHIATPWWKTYWFWALVTLLLLGLAYLLYKWRISQVRKEERMRSNYERKLTDMELSALRAQMNPHFIFNSLNSIEYYIISNEPEKASDYLNRFSRLIRLILQNSKNTIVPLQDDLNALKLYIEIESMRFDNLFEYEVGIEKGIDIEKIKVPPMLLQPYVENAIWHGLMQKEEGTGKIELSIREANDTLICIIEDNGIGREAAELLKSKTATKRKSFGMRITRDRLGALNLLAGTKASVDIIDLKNDKGEGCGTRVELAIPL